MSALTTSPTPSWPARLSAAAADIKLAHSVFALPFALLAAFLARPETGEGGWEGGWPRFWAQLALVVLCMVLARTWAMLINRIADAGYDAANPRTARRALPSGRLRPRDSITIAVTCAALFLVACSGFYFLFHNPWPLILALPLLAWLALYSYTKRFTALCHLVLGVALALSPIAAALAVDGVRAFYWEGVIPDPEIGTGGTPAYFVTFPGQAIVLLAVFITLWVAGFDILYALQDVAFDRSTGLFSIPAKLGPHAAVWLSRAMHAGACYCLYLVSCVEPRFGPLFTAALALTAALLIFEHIVLIRRGLAGLPMAFFTLNGCVSVAVGALGILDTLI